jgi:hypothetical protein
MSDYIDTGKLFVNDKKDANDPNDKRPLLSGYLVVDDDILSYLNELHSSGEELKFEVAAWKWRSKHTDKTYFSLSPQVPYKARAEMKASQDNLSDDIPFS